jgi:hypothetical protein
MIVLAAFFFLLSAGPLDLSVMRSVRMGEALMAKGWVLAEDPIVWAPRNPHWIEQQWMLDLLNALLMRGLGPTGLVWTRGLLAAVAAAGVLLWMRRRGVPIYVGSATVLLFGSLAHTESFGMAAMVDLVMTVAMLFVLFSGDGIRRVPWACPALIAIWANLHWGFLLGLAMALAHMVGSWRGWPGGSRWPYLGMLVAAPMLGPNGYHLYSALLWAPLQWSGPYFQLPPARWIIVATALLLGAYLLVERQRRSMRIFWAWSVAFSAMLINADWIPVYLWLCAAFAGETALIFRRLIPGGGAGFNSPLLFWALTVVIALSVAPRARWPAEASFYTSKYSPAVMAKLKEEGCRGRLLADVAFADALIAQGPGGCVPFLHSVYGAAKTSAYADYLRLIGPPQPSWIRGGLGVDPGRVSAPGVAEDWRDILEGYGVGAVLLSPSSQLAGLLVGSGNWGVAARDEAGVLLVRGRWRGFMNFPEKRPLDDPLAAGRRALDAGNPFRAIWAFREALSLDPAEAKLGLAEAHLLLGRKREALDLVMEAERSGPRGDLLRRIEGLRVRITKDSQGKGRGR